MNASRNPCLPKIAFQRQRRRWHAGGRPYYAHHYPRASSNYSGRRTSRRIYLILGVLAIVCAFLVLRFVAENHALTAVQRIRVATAQKEVRKLSAALDHYAQDNFTYPSTRQGLEALRARPATSPYAPNWKFGGYVKRLPLDPWGRPYQYFEPGVHGSAFDLFSLGADGKLGGRGVNADIGNWNSPG